MNGGTRTKSEISSPERENEEHIRVRMGKIFEEESDDDDFEVHEDEVEKELSFMENKITHLIKLQSELEYESAQRKITTDNANFFNDMKKLVNSQDFSDIQFKVQDQTIYAHKNILSTRSVYFNSLFKSGMKESSDGIIHFSDISYFGLIALLTYLYTNQLEVDPNTAIELLQVSEKYQLNDLKNACEEYIQNSIESENVVDVLLAADLHQATQLRKSCMRFIVDNFPKVASTKGFSRLVQNPMLLLEITQTVAQYMPKKPRQLSLFDDAKDLFASPD